MFVKIRRDYNHFVVIEIFCKHSVAILNIHNKIPVCRITTHWRHGGDQNTVHVYAITISTVRKPQKEADFWSKRVQFGTTLRQAVLTHKRSFPLCNSMVYSLRGFPTSPSGSEAARRVTGV